MWQSVLQGTKTEKKAVAEAAETEEELEEADEIAEIKRQAAAEVEAEKEKEKVSCCSRQVSFPRLANLVS